MKSKELTALELRMHRINAGLSPEALAEKISKDSGKSISGQTIRRLERGHMPFPSTAKQVADFLGVKVTELWPALLDDEEKVA